MTHPPMHIDELVEHWTILDEERDLVAGKRGATRLAFAILLAKTRWWSSSWLADAQVIKPRLDRQHPASRRVQPASRETCDGS